MEFCHNYYLNHVDFSDLESMREVWKCRQLLPLRYSDRKAQNLKSVVDFGFLFWEGERGGGGDDFSLHAQVFIVFDFTYFLFILCKSLGFELGVFGLRSEDDDH